MIYAGERPAVRREKALAALQRVGMEARLHHLPNQLSGGQQQRVSIARAIVNGPSLLLADEPTGALDSTTTKQVMELFCDLHRSGMTVVVVTHDPAIAAYAERVVTFQDGTILTDVTKDPHASSPDRLAAGSGN
jgi:putative ABC transport system ATP-binding protein